MQSYQMNTVKNLLADTLCEKSSCYIMVQLFDRFPTLPELFQTNDTRDGFLQREEFHIIQLNSKSHVIGKERISVGTTG